MSQSRSLVTAYYMVLFSVAVLVGLGIVMTISATTIEALSAEINPYLQGLSQGGFALLGLVIGLAFVHLPNRWWIWVAWLSLLVTFVLQVLVLLQGQSRGGNTAWLHIGVWTIQPAEFIKFALALWLGSVLALKSGALKSWGELIFPALIGACLAVGLVVLGDDAGTAAVIGLLALGALVMAGVPWSKLVTVLVIMAGLAAAVVLSSEQRRARFEMAFNSDLEVDRLGPGWQTSLATYSLAEGGLLGRGLGASRSKWYLSQAESDFIFAIIGEELGLVGALVVLVLFGVLGIGLLQIVRLHPDRFAQITIGAIACWLMGQALINIGMVIRVLPVIGVPLPFVSAGGSALVSCLAAIGVVVGLMRANPQVARAVAPRSRRVLRAAGVVPAKAPNKSSAVTQTRPRTKVHT